jgi:hypothetical protein
VPSANQIGALVVNSARAASGNSIARVAHMFAAIAATSRAIQNDCVSLWKFHSASPRRQK